jgi:hypothetical protein
MSPDPQENLVTTTAGNVRVGVSGEFYVGPTTADAPTSAVDTLDTDFKGLGFVSDDGVTESRERDTDDIVAWQNAATVRTLTTSSKLTYQFTLIETNKEVIEFVYGTDVTQDADEGTYTIDPGATGGTKSFVLDVIDGTETKRIYISEGEITDIGETKYASGEAIGYDVTVTAYVEAMVWDTSLST